MPDEFLLGYAGRVSILNQFASVADFRAFLKTPFSTNHSKHLVVPLITHLSKLLNIPSSFLIDQHTLINLIKCYKKNRQKTDYPSLLNRMSSRLNGVEFQFCRKCVEEDMSYNGFSYWRRDHQNHGTDACTKHSDEILLAAQGSHELFFQPSWHLKNFKYQEQYISLEEKQNPYIANYQKLINDFLDAPFRLDFFATTQLLVEKTKELGIKTYHFGYTTYLSDLVAEKFPTSWLIKHFPVFDKKYKNEYLYPIDNTICGDKSFMATTNYLLIVAILLGSFEIYPTTNEASNSELVDLELRYFLDKFIQQT